MIRFARLRNLPVQFNYLHQEMIDVLKLVSIWAVRNGKVVYVTSMNDHVHQDKSLHYDDLAIDFDVHGNREEDLAKLTTYLQAYLNPGYDVINEGDHVHVEFDVRIRHAN